MLAADLATLVLAFDAAECLAERGEVDPFAAELPDELLDELIVLAGSLAKWPGTETLVAHWYGMKQEQYERALPTWTCTCGTVYKAVPAMSSGRVYLYYACDDGLLSEGHAGYFAETPGGRVKHSDKCQCGRVFPGRSKGFST